MSDEQIRILIQKGDAINGLREFDRSDQLLFDVPDLDIAFITTCYKEPMSDKAINESDLFLVLVLIRRFEKYELIV